MGFTATLEAIAESLRVAGLEAGTAASDVNPPGALVTPAAIVPPSKMCGTYTLRAFVDLVARDAGDDNALGQLETLHVVATAVLKRQLTDAEQTFTRRPLASDPTALPALRLTIETPLI